MSSEDLSFEELSQAFARAMRGNTSSSEGRNSAGNTAGNSAGNSASQSQEGSSNEELIDIPDELLGDDFSDDELEDGAEDSLEENDSTLSMFDENESSTSAENSGGFRSFADEIDDDRLVPVTPQTILEAMLFVGNPANTPIRPEILSNLMRGVSVREIHDLVKELNAQYEASGTPWEIVWFEEENGYFMQLRESFSPLRENFYGKIRQAKLSQGAIDTLAIVAYEQPLSLDEINQLRGTSSASILAQLVRRQLLRSQKVRQGTKFTTVYYTTERFLKLFELESVSDLPQSEDLDRE